MIVFKEDLLTRVSEDLAHVQLIEAQLKRYARRLDYWVERHLELEVITVDSKTRTVTFRDNSIVLTKRVIVEIHFRGRRDMLMNRPERYFSAGQLLVEAWHDSRLPEESLRTYISRVRKKLKELGADAEVVNKSRKGYALVFKAHKR